jgi:membrane-bound lytic murein transglycosylase B
MGIYNDLSNLDVHPPDKSHTTKKYAVKKLAQDITPKVPQTRDKPRKVSSDNPRDKSRQYPSRNEIQEFSFRLRDQVKVKVQSEVPLKWQKELEEIAHQLNVKKLELYRFMIGEFLGKVKRIKPK